MEAVTKIRLTYPIKHPWHVETVKRFFACDADARAFIADLHQARPHHPYDGSTRQMHEYKTAEVMLLLIGGRHYELGVPVDDLFPRVPVAR